MQHNPRTSYIILSLLAILICTVYSDCPISYYPRQTTIGYVKVDIDITSNSSPRPQIYQYPLVQQLKSTAYTRTVVGVNGFSFDKQTQQYGFKIQPALTRNPITTVIFSVSTVGQRRWKYIMFNFIVSDSSQLALGSKNILELTPNMNPNNFRVSEQLALPSNNYNYRATAKVFISGFQIKQKNTLSKENKQKIQDNVNKLRNFVNFGWNKGLIKKYVGMLSIDQISSLNIDSVLVNPNGLLTFQVITSQVKLKALSYSFIVYYQRISSEVFYQTVTDSFVLGDQDSHFYNSLEHDDMKILGFSGFKFSSDVNQTISLQIRTGNTDNRNFYVGNIQGVYTEFNFQYFAISSLPGAACKTCPGSPLIYQEFCVSQCPPGFVSSVNSDGSYFCHECNVEGFLIASEDKRKCTCASGHYLVSPIQQCTQCPYDCLTCNGNMCLTCDTTKPSSFRVLNPSTGRCECPAMSANGVGLYDDYSLQQRICVMCNSRCKTCRGPEITDCLSCAPRRTLFNGMCRCDDNLIESQNGDCACLPPYTQNQYGQCTLTGTQCKQNQMLVTVQLGVKSCNCKPGYTRSLVSNICIKQCQSYEQYNYVTSACECRDGLVRNTTSKICYSCTSRVNRVYNDQIKSCECMPGFQINRAGECTSCPSKSYYNIKNDSCDCIFNYYRQYDNGPCVKCQNQWDGPSCQKLSNMQGLQL